MAVFEELTGGGGGGNKKKRLMFFGIGIVIILFIVVFRRSTSGAAQVTAAAEATPLPQVTDIPSYPNLNQQMLDQQFGNYLAISEQYTTSAMQSVNDTLGGLQTHMDKNNDSLIAAIKANQTAAIVTTPAPTPVTPAQPVTSSHPAPASVTHVVAKGETLSGITTAMYGKQPAYAKGIKQVAALNKISNPNRIQVGQKIVLPSKLS